jgi:hypothetical protein
LPTGVGFTVGGFLVGVGLTIGVLVTVGGVVTGVCVVIGVLVAVGDGNGSLGVLVAVGDGGAIGVIVAVGGGAVGVLVADGDGVVTGVCVVIGVVVAVGDDGGSLGILVAVGDGDAIGVNVDVGGGSFGVWVTGDVVGVFVAHGPTIVIPARIVIHTPSPFFGPLLPVEGGVMEGVATNLADAADTVDCQVKTVVKTDILMNMTTTVSIKSCFLLLCIKIFLSWIQLYIPKRQHKQFQDTC